MHVLREISTKMTESTSATSGAISKLSELASQLRRTVAGFTLPDQGTNTGVLSQARIAATLQRGEPAAAPSEPEAKLPERRRQSGLNGTIRHGSRHDGRPRGAFARPRQPRARHDTRRGAPRARGLRRRAFRARCAAADGRPTALGTRRSKDRRDPRGRAACRRNGAALAGVSPRRASTRRRKPESKR